jgi:hypothetical protein
MIDRCLEHSFLRRIAWFLVDHGIMREAVEEAYKRRLLASAPTTVSGATTGE